MSLGNVERASKRRRLRELDEQAQARVECIVREQLDLEVYLKQKEISTIAERLRHSEVLLNVLKSAIQSQQHTHPSLDDVADGLMSHMRRLAVTSSHRQGSPYQLHADAAAPARKRGRPRRSAAMPARYTDEHPRTLYAQRADGSTVRMLCPYCGRDDFVSLQGFMNHARLDHDAHFASHDEAISICGVDADVSGDRDDDQPDSDQSAVQRKTTTATPQAPRYDSLMNRLTDNQRTSVTDALDYINKPKDVEQASSDAESDSDAGSVAAYSKHRAITGGNAAENMAPTLRAQDSRFHVVRRAIFGNTSQYIDSARRPAGHENSTHRWTAFIRNAANERPVDEYIRKVRVFLHPSYRPDDIVDLVPPKFELSRWGWGEFPVRLQVFFCDKRNKPVEMVYMLKLDDACTGACVPGAEVPIDFELDRRGLSLGESLAGQLDSEMTDSLISPPPANAVLCELLKALCRTYPLVLSDALPANCQAPKVPEAILELVPAAVTARWTWGVAMTADIWRNSWPIGKRLSAEASRNRCLLSVIHAVLDRQDGDIADGNVGAGDSDTNATTCSLRSRLANMATALCSACAVEAEVTESLTALILSSTSETCVEAIELLQLWRNEYRTDRTIRADQHRGLQERSFAWSLRRWLRHNGFVPEPVLSDREMAVCVPSTACVAGLQLTVADDSSCPEPVLAKHEFFCSACGMLCVLRQKTDIEATCGEGSTAAANNGPSSVPPETMYCCSECKAVGTSHLTTVSRVNNVLAKLPHGWDLADDENDADALLMVDDDEASYAIATPAKTSKFEDIARSLSRYHLQQQKREKHASNSAIAPDSAPADTEATGQENGDVGDGSGGENNGEAETTDELVIDWVWSAIHPLELTCAPAFRFSAGSDINDAGESTELAGTSGALVQLADSTGEMNKEALDQRLVVGRLLADVTRMFLRDLVAAADQTMRKNQAARISDSEPSGSLVDAETKRRLLMLTPLHVLAAVKQDSEVFDVCSNAFLADGL
ncbi:hypothetical protein H4R27_001373 [Coemansia aciculifera]|nr:hypothetical protein H4R27_001373 [Coemansia aciculifera]